ncbi:hypothetical protein [Psychrobacter urativorans]|uniref:Uncharacterized protein n=1 Tax=Psychrobacter urativorans TaxID=45610 RepID=A0A0M5MK16_9GAMM|nr:hypothetical protein [Psychrobacter urativorans]ALF59780.1 hypothetical protein AOC03_06815 [Psychrobacter urativorans]
MAVIHQTYEPILNSNAQVLVLPVNNAGTLLDPVLMRTKTLYPDNYQSYRRRCLDGSLKVGSCLLHKRQREQAGLSASTNSNQPNYIANLVISDHPYHATHLRWLGAALIECQQQLLPLIRDQGVRRIAVLTRPFIVPTSPNNDGHSPSDSTNHLNIDSSSAFKALDWHSEILPLFTQHLQDLPKVRIDLHLPKFIAINID